MDQGLRWRPAIRVVLDSTAIHPRLNLSALLGTVRRSTATGPRELALGAGEEHLGSTPPAPGINREVSYNGRIRSGAHERGVGGLRQGGVHGTLHELCFRPALPHHSAPTCTN